MNIDISTELAEHFERIKDLTVAIQERGADKDIIAAMNSLTTMIKELVKVQEDLYNSTTFAIFQQVLITTLQDFDKSAAEEFLNRLDAAGVSISQYQNHDYDED